jgi:estrone sulfotransferase
MTWYLSLQDLEGVIRKTATFLGKTLTEPDVRKLSEHLSFKNMKKNPSVNLEPIMAKKNGPDFLQTTELSFLRKGEVGDWKNHMTPDMASQFDAWTEKNIRGTALTFD